MDNEQPVLQFIYNHVDEDVFKKYFRLVIIVCVYIFARQFYANWAKQKQIRHQLAADKAEKEMEQQRRETEASEVLERVDNEAKGFGWGKATRRNVKHQEKVLQDTSEQLRQQAQDGYDAAEDHDIEDLLED